MPQLRWVFPLLLCLLPALAIGQTQSASTQNSQPSELTSKPCVNPESAKEVLRLGRSLRYPDDQILEAYGQDPCATLSYLRQEAQQNSDSDYKKRYDESSEPEKAKILGEYYVRNPESFSKSAWAKGELLNFLKGLEVPIAMLLVGIGVLISSRWVDRIPVPNRFGSVRKWAKEIVKWGAIGFLTSLIVPSLIGFLYGFGWSAGWYQISPITLKWLDAWATWVVIGILALIASAREALKKRRRAAQLEQTKTDGVSVL